MTQNDLSIVDTNKSNCDDYYFNNVGYSTKQVNDFQESYGKSGGSLSISCGYSKIPERTIKQWLSIASLVNDERDRKADAFDESKSNNRRYRHTYQNYNEDMLSQYRNSLKYKKYCNIVEEIIAKAEELKMNTALAYLQVLQNSTSDKRINPYSAMWFLERRFKDDFAKEVDRTQIENSADREIKPITIEYVSPNDKQANERVEQMEKELREQLGMTEAKA